MKTGLNLYGDPIVRAEGAITKVYRLPRRFAMDHWHRDCGRNDEIIRETKTHLYVEMDAEGYGDMESDADYYADAGSEMGRDYAGLIASARATLAALRKQGAPE